MIGRILTISGAFLLPFCMGCLFSYTKECTIRSSEKKRAAQFENYNAKALFQSAVDARIIRAKPTSEATLNLPFIASITRRKKLSPAAIYNDELCACDSDGNGIVTEVEAQIYHRRHAWECNSCEVNGVLTQSGEVPLDAEGPIDVYYPHPYVSNPSLAFRSKDDDRSYVDYQKLEQRPDGFRLYLTWNSPSWGNVEWTARGMPVKEDPNASVHVDPPRIPKPDQKSLEVPE